MKGVLSYILLVLSFYVYIYRPGFIAYPPIIHSIDMCDYSSWNLFKMAEG